MNLSREALKEIEDFAFAGMSIIEIAIIVEVSRKDFFKAAKNEKSEIYKAIQRGRLKASAKVRITLINLAAQGNSIAAKQIMEIWKENDIAEKNYEKGY